MAPIGPRMQNGKFTKVRKPRTKKAKAAAVAHSLTPNQKKEVKILITKPVERKYVVSDRFGPSTSTGAGTNVPIPSSLTSVGWDSTSYIPAMGYLYNPIPDLSQGVQTNQRIGNRISRCVIRSHFEFYLDNLFLSTRNVVVRLFQLTSKQAKSFYLAQKLKPNTLLDTGDQVATDWLPQSTGFTPSQLAFMPLQGENWGGRHYDFLLSKNQGIQNDDLTTSTTQPNLSAGRRHVKTLVWSHKAALKYDDEGGANQIQPTNYCPLWGVLCWYADGKQQLPSSERPTLIPGVNMSVRNDMYYYDV